MFMLVITVQAGRQADDNLNSLVYYYLSVNGKPARFFLSFFLAWRCSSPALT
jgi:hypothetical protein